MTRYLCSSVMRCLLAGVCSSCGSISGWRARAKLKCCYQCKFIWEFAEDEQRCNMKGSAAQSQDQNVYYSLKLVYNCCLIPRDRKESLSCGHFIHYHLSSPLSALILFLLHYFLPYLFCRVRSRLSIYQINSLSLLL